TGGTGPYTYDWSDNTSNSSTNGLSPGLVTVTVTDANNCKATNTTTINEPAPLTLVMDSLNISCNGGSDGQASVVVSGGTPGYQYQWVGVIPGNTATITGLSANTYTVNVT